MMVTQWSFAALGGDGYQKNINIWHQSHRTTEEHYRQCVRLGSSRHGLGLEALHTGTRLHVIPFNLRFTEGIGTFLLVLFTRGTRLGAGRRLPGTT